LVSRALDQLVEALLEAVDAFDSSVVATSSMSIPTSLSAAQVRSVSAGSASTVRARVP
jgi:hypothetical protein